MTTFAELGLPNLVVRVLDKQGITTPFPIQEQAIPDVLAGRDVLGRGPTGSGKTFTFGLPMLTRLADSGVSRPGKPRGLVLAPTRELATQIQQRLDEPANALGLRVLSVVGGVNINNHIRSLARPVDLLVATPGRAQDLVNQKELDLSQVEITTLDEADQMADMGFFPQVRKLMKETPAKGQRLLFSATLDGDVNKLVDQFMTDPVTHSTAPEESSVDTMEHFLLYVGGRAERADVVTRIAARAGKTILFMRTKHGVDRQAKKLRRAGINAMPLHGDKGQGARTRAIEGFGDGSVPVLVATDIAARGIDIHDVSLVVHVDPPAEHKAYLHRAGRTARGGAAGTVVTLVMDEQRDEVAKLIKNAGVKAAIIDLTSSPDPSRSPELGRITGAKDPSGIALPLPGQQQTPNSSAGRKDTGSRRAGSRSRGRSGTRRTDDSRSSNGRSGGRSSSHRGKGGRSQGGRGQSPRGGNR